MIYLDAHNHLQHDRLSAYRGEAIDHLIRLPLRSAVVNGTRETDWAAVAELSSLYEWVIPSFGIHPWYVKDVSDTWNAKLESMLNSFPAAAVGEIGLDRWVEGYDLAVQTPIFIEQLRLAVKFERAVSIHCVRAWGGLLDVLRAERLPSRGFLLHAYGGPVEMTQEFIRLGAYFSFSPYFLHARKAAQREVFRTLPIDRLLVETDAPDMAPPDELTRFHIRSDGMALNHPMNITVAYEELARLREMSLAQLSDAVATNFDRLFR